MGTLTPEQVMKILEVTDSFNLHRESVLIPLATEGTGRVEATPDQRLRITVPDQQFDEWLVELRTKLSNMDLSFVRS
jgi:hypothetical protein